MLKRRLSNKELRELSKELPFPIGKGREVFETESERGKLLIVDGLVSFFKYEKRWLPTLQLMLEVGLDMPAVYVDRGAIPFVVKGADVMRPGIKHVEGEFKKGEPIVVRDAEHGQPLAIGIAHLNKEQLIESKKGKMVKNLHHINDWIWRINPVRGPRKR